ncbi:hypothetical protein [Natrinema saccharevitans]|uniref:hypothetical protein n=1 Tax=Natrinema saccharevitans TaxID=301967 RepID=UPI001115A1C5|nr:hypothetical protein [Natrinema saccharevitans]
MTATNQTDDHGIVWLDEPLEECGHDPIPATIGSTGSPIDCSRCGASGVLINHYAEIQAELHSTALDEDTLMTLPTEYVARTHGN